MNPRMEKLEKWRGFPIPFFATKRTDGSPDFKVTDEKNRMRCVIERLCWICGQPLKWWMVFIGGPRAISARLFVDGPCHPECANDAMEICPFLMGSIDYSKDLHHMHPNAEVHERVSNEPPEEIGLLLTRGFGVRSGKDYWFFYADLPKAVRWVPRKHGVSGPGANPPTDKSPGDGKGNG